MGTGAAAGGWVRGLALIAWVARSGGACSTSDPASPPAADSGRTDAPAAPDVGAPALDAPLDASAVVLIDVPIAGLDAAADRPGTTPVDVPIEDRPGTIFVDVPIVSLDIPDSGLCLPYSGRATLPGARVEYRTTVTGLGSVHNGCNFGREGPEAFYEVTLTERTLLSVSASPFGDDLVARSLTLFRGCDPHDEVAASSDPRERRANCSRDYFRGPMEPGTYGLLVAVGESPLRSSTSCEWARTRSR